MLKHTITAVDLERSFHCDAEQLLLQAGREAGLALPFLCAQNDCGRCKVRLLSGEVEQRESHEQVLSAEEKARGMILLCHAKPRSDVRYASLNPHSIHTVPVRVVEIDDATAAVKRLKLKLPRASSFSWNAGQYVDILLPSGAKRSYSLAKRNCADGHIELHIKYIDGGRFSAYAFSDLKTGAILRIRGPLGVFGWNKQSAHSILIATGTGIAPLYAMLEALIANPPTFQVKLYWGGQTIDDLYLHASLMRMQEAHDWFDYVPVLSRNQDPQWKGRSGYVQHNVVQDYDDFKDCTVHCAGSPKMTDATLELLLKKGLPRANWHCDAFEFSHECG